MAAAGRVLTISRHPFDPRCPWEGGAKNHIQLDLADIGNVLTAMPQVREIVGDQLVPRVAHIAVACAAYQRCAADDCSRPYSAIGHNYCRS